MFHRKNLQSTSSQLTSEDLVFPQSSASRRDLTLPLSGSLTGASSRAENYIASCMLSCTSDASPDTPSSSGSSRIGSQHPASHNKFMQKWYQKVFSDALSKNKHCYTYGTPASPSSAPMPFNARYSAPPSSQSMLSTASSAQSERLSAAPVRANLDKSNDRTTSNNPARSRPISKRSTAV
jgi:hypothetical protein